MAGPAENAKFDRQHDTEGSVLQNFVQNLWRLIAYNADISVSIALLSIALTLLLRRWLARRCSSYLAQLIFKKHADPHEGEQFFQAVYPPVSSLFLLIGLSIALRFLPLSVNHELFIQHVFRTGFIGIMAWCLYNLSKDYVVVSADLKGIFTIDPLLVPFFSKAIRVLILVFAFMIIISEWGYDINGFMAGLGLGGLAIALAAQSLLSNLIAGFVIITDKPFSIKDWISTPQVEGVVEDMNFRSTKIRTFAQALVTVPNSTLANEAITNWTRMGKRQLRFTVGLTYSTTRQQMERCVGRIKQMLLAYAGIDNEVMVVNFDKFNDSSLDINIYCFTITKAYAEYQEIKQDINLNIMTILEEEGASIAFPTRSLYFENKMPGARPSPE